MAYSDKGNSEGVEAIINTLNIEGATLTDPNLSALNELEHLAELSQDLNMPSDTENQGSEEEMSTVHIEEPEDELVQTELGAQEIEIETEHVNSPEEILPETKPKTVPPLRPLTIAPKPTKVPITYKPVAGQQLFLLQGSASGQQLKLVPQGINLSNLSNFSLAKPLAMKPTIKAQPAQPKQIVMKKVVTQLAKPAQAKTSFENKGHVVVVQKTEPQMKLVSQGNVALSTPTKTITLAQAQQMGLLAGAKLVPQTNTSKHAVVLNKSQNKGIKVINQIRSPTKILPAPQISTANKVTQRILIKPSSSPALITPSQLIQVAGTQPITTGQIHQINIPGKGVQYIKFVTSQADSTLTTTPNTTVNTKATTQNLSIGSKVVTFTGNTNSETGNIVLSEIKPINKTNVIVPKPAKPAVSIQSANINFNNSGNQLLMVPASYLQRTSTPKVAIPVRTTATKAANSDAVVPVNDSVNLESNGMRTRKPCNCTKSQCLKLYCDCFANGEFCYMCNCMNCFNNLENEEHRQRAIKNCLERNPNAFRPKIGKAKDTGDTPIRKHTKGCNCKRSGCFKNYCECYEAKIACSSNCKCVGCRNIEDSMDKTNVRPQNVDVVFGRTQQQSSKVAAPNDNILHIRPKRTTTNKQAINYINTDVIEATTQCLLALANNAESNGQNEDLTKKQVIEEFGRCLIDIIDCSIKRSQLLHI